MTEEEKANMTPEELAEWEKNHPAEGESPEQGTDAPMTAEEKADEKEIEMI